MGLRQALGEGPFPVAGGAGREVYHDAAGRTSNACERVGCCRSAAAQELAAPLAGGIKHFFPFVCKKAGNYSASDLQSNLLDDSFRSPSSHRRSRTRVSLGT